MHIAIKLLVRTSAGVAVLAMLGVRANAQTWVANLAGPNESPPNASAGTGSAVVSLAGNHLTVNIVFSNLSAPTTASHIHCCTATALTGTAGVATAIPTFPGFPLGVTNGTYTQVFDLALASSYNPAFITANGGTPSSAEAALVAGLTGGKSYLNIHTTAFPAGEVRGFLTTVPEPSAALLLASGLAALGGITRMRRGRVS